MGYIYNNFIKPVSPDDNNLQIIDSTGKITYTINPFSVIDTFISNNLVKISIKSGNVIILDFFTVLQAQQALISLQSAIDVLLEKVPVAIDKGIFNYINQKIDYDAANITNLGGVTFSGDIIPRTDSTYKIGNSSRKWTDLYLSNGLFLNGLTLSNSNSALKVLGLDLGQTASPFKFTTDGTQLIFNGTTSLPISYNNLKDLPLTLDSFSRFNSNGEIAMNDSHLYINGNGSLRFTNGFGVSGSTPLVEVWSGNGPLSSGSTSSEFEQVDFQRAAISFNMEDTERSSLSLKTWDWSLGVTNSINYEVKLHNGNIIIPDVGDIIRDGQSVLYRYTGTSSNALQLPEVGNVVYLNTQNRLGFKQGQGLIVYNTIDNTYVVDDYVDDIASYFIGEVTGYNFNSGLLELVVTNSPSFGLTNNDGIVPTFSAWQIEISPNNILNIKNALDNSLFTSDGSSGFIAEGNLTFDGLTFSVNGGTKLLGETQFQQTIEVLNTSTASSTITYDFSLGSVWYHDDLANDFLVDLVNVPEIQNRAITITIIVSQGSPAYYPNSLNINGSNYGLLWSGGTPPTPNENQTDIFGFSLINWGGNWTVLGQISTFA